jgi:predicted enzyme related to lactoylglutathione lyase
MAKEIRLADLVVDCPDAEKLCSFYQVMLGWKKTELFGKPAVISENGVVFLFSQEEDYVPPVWPEEEGRQQKQIHFDFVVPDLPAAVAKAEALGATKTEAQFGGDQFVTLLDPAGHPFCLCREE